MLLMMVKTLIYKEKKKTRLLYVKHISSLKYSMTVTFDSCTLQLSNK